MPVLLVNRDDGSNLLVGAGTVPGAEATTVEQTSSEVAATLDDTSGAEAMADEAAPAEESADDQPEASAESEPEPESEQKPEPEPEPEKKPDPEPEILTLGSIKSKADEKGYDVHGHVEHSVYLLGQQVLIPGQASTGGFIQTSDNNYMAYSPVTAMLPVAIQDNKEVVEKKPNLEGEKLYRRLAQEYTGSNDYKKLNKDAQRAINILTCTDWSTVEKRVRENTINHLLHSPISFGTIGSVEEPISTDVTIDLGYTHTRDKNWTEVEYMDNNVYKITVVSNNNNGSHTGHEMGTAYVEMPEGTSLKEAQKIGNQMIPSKNKNNKLTIDAAARALFDSLPRGASPMILFEHLSEEEQNAFFEGRGIETVGQPNPDCNPLAGGILDSGPAPVEEEPAPEDGSDDPTAPAEGDDPAAGDPASGDEAPVEGETPVDESAPVEGETPPVDEAPPAEDETPPAGDDTPPADEAPPGDDETPPAADSDPPASDDPPPVDDEPPAEDQAAPDPSSDSG